MLVTRVNRWSLTYCRCLGIKIHSQKSGVKSEELVVERSLKLDALNLHWLGVIDGPLTWTIQKRIPLSLVLLQEKNCEIKGCILNLLNFVSLLGVEKELCWGKRLVQHTKFGSYQITLRFQWKIKVWSFGSGNDFKASICIMPSLYEL